MNKWLIVVSVFLAVVGGIAVGQDGGTGGAPGSSASPTPTASATAAALDPVANIGRAEAINLVHHINGLEVQTSQEALGRLQDQEARQFAQRMITEHQALEQQVVNLAAQEDVALFAFQPSTYESAEANRLRALSGNDYDRGYMEVQQQGHESALKDLQQAKDNVDDPEIQALLDQAITAVQQHLDQAGQIQPEATPSPTSSPTSTS